MLYNYTADFDKKKHSKSSWQHRDFSVMFTTENEIIRSSWKQIYRLKIRVYSFAYLTFDPQAPCRHDFDCVGEQFPGHLMDMFESLGIHALFYKKKLYITDIASIFNRSDYRLGWIIFERAYR